VDPGPLGRRAEPGLRVREKLVRERVRANLLAEVTPSEAAVVDAAAARHANWRGPPEVNALDQAGDLAELAMSGTATPRG
jgi:hypothetical protein